MLNENNTYCKYVFNQQLDEPVYFTQYKSNKVIFRLKEGTFVDFRDTLDFIVYFPKKEFYLDYEADYFKILSHFVNITKNIKKNVFVNFKKLNLLSLKNQT